MTNEIEEINEIQTIIIIRLKGGLSFLLPKNKIDNIDSVKKRLKELSVFLNIKYVADEKWAWR